MFKESGCLTVKNQRPLFSSRSHCRSPQCKDHVQIFSLSRIYPVVRDRERILDDRRRRNWVQAATILSFWGQKRGVGRSADPTGSCGPNYILKLLRRLQRLISCLRFPNKIHNFQKQVFVSSSGTPRGSVSFRDRERTIGREDRFQFDPFQFPPRCALFGYVFREIERSGVFLLLCTKRVRADIQKREK